MNNLSNDVSAHYNRVTPAWNLLLGDNLHYGLFETGRETLSEATSALTHTMAVHGKVGEGDRVLDVGCGTGQPACTLVERYGAQVVGISTSDVGIAAARARAEGLGQKISFRLADGMNNGLPETSFDRIWIMESSHLMADKAALFRESARVLRPGGRLVLCDIIRKAPLPIEEVIKRRDAFLLLRDVFGRARMESLAQYRDLALQCGLEPGESVDVSARTRQTFEKWRENAVANAERVSSIIGPEALDQFIASCEVLEALWDEGILGYAVIAVDKPVS